MQCIHKSLNIKTNVIYFTPRIEAPKNIKAFSCHFPSLRKIRHKQCPGCLAVGYRLHSRATGFYCQLRKFNRSLKSGSQCLQTNSIKSHLSSNNILHWPYGQRKKHLFPLQQLLRENSFIITQPWLKGLIKCFVGFDYFRSAVYDDPKDNPFYWASWSPADLPGGKMRNYTPAKSSLAR